MCGRGRGSYLNVVECLRFKSLAVPRKSDGDEMDQHEADAAVVAAFANRCTWTC